MTFGRDEGAGPAELIARWAAEGVCGDWSVVSESVLGAHTKGVCPASHSWLRTPIGSLAQAHSHRLRAMATAIAIVPVRTGEGRARRGIPIDVVFDAPLRP
jgi:hypothetical protein